MGKCPICWICWICWICGICASCPICAVLPCFLLSCRLLTLFFLCSFHSVTPRWPKPSVKNVNKCTDCFVWFNKLLRAWPSVVLCKKELIKNLATKYNASDAATIPRSINCLNFPPQILLLPHHPITHKELITINLPNDNNHCPF